MKHCEASGVKLEFSVPYYHESNGRIERANRTIRNALKKTKGPLKIKLHRALAVYNNSIHRGIGMSPIEARKEQNFRSVTNWQSKYKNEFGLRNKHKINFELNQRVLVRNENKHRTLMMNSRTLVHVRNTVGKDLG